MEEKKIGAPRRRESQQIAKVWNRAAYNIKVESRDGRDDALIDQIEEAGRQLGLEHRSDGVRVIIALASLDLPPADPERKGHHVAELNAELSLKRAEHEKRAQEQEATEAKPAKKGRVLGAVIDYELFSVIAVVYALERYKHRSDAEREVLQHGLDLLEQGGENVEKFLAALKEV